MFATLAFSLLTVLSSRILLGKFLRDQDPALSWSLSGLIGLGASGLLVFFSCLVHSSFGLLTPWPIFFIAALVGLRTGTLKNIIHLKGGNRTGLLVAGICSIPVLLSLIGASAPSTTLDWDSLAYHLAVPKIWNQEGHISFISYIHHS